MPHEIDVPKLQEWLAQQKPVTVLDIRSPADREQWWIPGSIHADVYESLKAGDAGGLDNLVLPQQQPVVTVCGSGRMSLEAAEALEARGLSALSLQGGMKAWSLAWNTASRLLEGVEIIQVRRAGKGCLSYLVLSGGEAAVIDASLDPAVYLSLAQAGGASIRYVLDTHIHADHLSRARRLAEASSGAQLVLPQQDRVRFSHTPVVDGDKLPLGGTSIEVLSTPGHTGESVSYLVPNVAVFSGDTLFLNGVGRPDLHADGREAATRARMLFGSVSRLTALDAQLLLFPGHTSEPVPFDQEMLTASVGVVAGRLKDWLASEDEFVNRLLARLPPSPPNYALISQLNESGEWPDSDPTDLEAGANRCAIS